MATVYSGPVSGYVDVWLPVTLAADTQYTLTMTGAGTVNAANAGFYLYESGKARSITSGYAYSTPTPYGPYALKAGSYWIHVWVNDRFASGSYTITTSETAAPLADDGASNTIKSAAVEATLATASTGHLGYSDGNTRNWEDWWKFTLPGDTVLSIDFSSTGQSDLFLAYSGYYLYSADDRQMNSTTGLGSSAGPFSLKAGTYYLKFWTNRADEYGSYSFTPRHAAAPLDNDTEPNDSKAAAKEARLNVRNTGHLGYDGSSHDWEDWWKLTLSSDDTLTLNFETSGVSDLFLAYSGYYLYDSSDRQQNSSTGLGSSGATLDLKAGTYYLKFWVNSAYHYGSYAFTPTLKNSPGTGSTGTTSLMDLGAWTVYGTASLQGGTLTIGDIVGYDTGDTDKDGNPYNLWYAGSVSGQSGVDYDEALSVQEFSPPLKLSWAGCFPETSQGYNNIILGRKNQAFTGSPNTQQYLITQEFGFSTRWDKAGLNTTVLGSGSGDPQQVAGAVATSGGYCGDYRIEWADNLLKFYYGGVKVREQAYAYAGPVSVVVRSFDKPHTLTAISMETGPVSPTTSSDCLFNWAERTYPALFAPAASSNTLAPYYYRYYAQTGAYLGISSADSKVYYLGPLSGNTLLGLGALTTWLPTAGCQ